MRHRLIKVALPTTLALTLVLGTSGCGKKETKQAAPPPTPTADTQPAPQQAPQQVQSTAQPAAQQSDAAVSELNRALIRWIVGHKRRPATFEEFAASAGAPIPPPPAGKKYVLVNPPRIQLVNQ